MNKAGNGGQFDNDILQCKVDILRARDVVRNPATQNDAGKPAQAPDLAETSTNEDTSMIPIEEIPAKEIAPLPRPVGSETKKEEVEETLEVPSFDLAEEMMAEQRRITAIKRKAPGEKTEAQRVKPEVKPVDHIIEEPKPALSEQNKIIAEIVAKDIEKLCRGDYSAKNE